MVLSSVEPGKEVTLIDIIGGKGIKSKLYGMGLVPGISLKVFNRNGYGPLIIGVKDSKLVMGQGMASRIVVE